MSAKTIDFLKQRRTPLMGWMLLAIGCTSALVATEYRGRVADNQALRRAAAQQHVEAQARERDRLRQRTAPTPSEHRLAGARLQLQWPWLPTLRTIENTTERPVFLNLLSVDPASGRVQIEGEAPGYADILGYLSSVSEQGALVSARLVAHEQVSDAMTGGTKLRFTLAAQWTTK